ncbi:MAG TPA: SRPBCC family protein [Miltoncostaeaceae bacterium]|nr:SRPBCC family protein [Miltoncostaeaceae bacterium]
MAELRVVGELPLSVSAERAWELWSRVEDWPRWDWVGSADARWLQGEPWTEGARLRVGHRPRTFDAVLVVVDPPREVTTQARGLGIGGRHTYRFLSRGNGCVFRMEETFHGRGARLLKPLVRWYWGRQMLAFRRFAEAADSTVDGRD